MSSQEFGAGASIFKVQKQGRTPRLHCETRNISISNDSRNSHGHYIGASRMFRTTADAVSAYNQVKMEDAPTLLKVPKSECPGVWIRLPKHKWPKSWSSMDDPVVPLETNLYGHPPAGLLWEWQFEKVLLERGWEKVPN